MADQIRLMKVRDAAPLWGVSPETLRRWVRQGLVTGVRIGSTYRVAAPPEPPPDSQTDQWGLPLGALPPRASNALLRAGYRSREDLEGVTDYQIRDLRNVGDKTLRQMWDAGLPLVWHFVEVDGTWLSITGEEWE